MDRALEKINKLSEKLNNLYSDMDNIEDAIDFKNTEKRHLSNSYDNFKSKECELNSKKKYIQNISANLNKSKRKMLVYTSITILIFEIVLVSCLCYFNFSAPAIKAILTFNIPGILYCVFCGDVDGYRSKRKYLKKNKIKDVEKEIDENNKYLKSYDKEMNDIEIELSNLLIKQEEIKNKINLTETEIEKLEDIRNTVINNYINDNQELDNIINNEYEKQHQLIIKKDSNK